jgi:hypothetical protein
MVSVPARFEILAVLGFDLNHRRVYPKDKVVEPSGFSSVFT